MAADARSQSDVIYLYDAAGRLVGVVDQTGAAAAYQYDAVGNILSVARLNPGTVSILAFTPISGSIGSTVVISGTGFSTTPSQNALTFNGTAATVSSSTTTQLVATVPIGATTGTLSVTTPNGSATSAQSFVITTDPGTPTITGFSPSIGAAGVTVTISGTGFDTTVANDRVIFNRHLGSVSAASATSISATVPTSVSGPISVQTPFGTALSSSDFFIPPPPYTAADVVFTDRLTMGVNKSVPIGTANKIALLTLPVTAGGRISVKAQSPFSGVVKMTSPDGYLVASVNLNGGSITNFIEPFAVYASGIYSFLVDPAGTATGTPTVAAYDVPPDILGTITPDGPTVPMTTTAPGQNAKFTFSGTAGQRYSLRMTNDTMPNPKAWISILNPDGSTGGTVDTGAGSTFLDPVTLTATGTATVFVNPTNVAFGSVTLALYTVPPDVTGTIVPSGDPVPISLTAPGQNALLTFSGVAGQRISAIVTGSLSATIRILKPDGTFLSGTSANINTFVEPVILPTTGTYTLVIDGFVYNVGSATAFVFNVPSDVSGSITPGGSDVNVTLSAGQNAKLTFSGTANQRVAVKVISTIASRTVKILKPDSSLLAQVQSLNQGSLTWLDTVALPTTGTYTVVVDPVGNSTGDATVTLYDVPADITGTITPGGSSVTVTTTTPGQKARLTFSGTSGQRIAMRSESSLSSWQYGILNPNGTIINSILYPSSNPFWGPNTLTATGTFTVVVDPKTNAGAVTVTVFDVPADITGTIDPNGAAVPITISVPGQRAVLSFTGTASQQVTVSGSGSTLGYVSVVLSRHSNGATVTYLTPSATDFSLATVSLPANDTYDITLYTYSAGSLTFTVTSP